ncbi:RNA polymerase sigma-70 factor (sigma-E family) [Kribbella orskensis]|uniref:RNA polymerase sigma-70 factor (Sigma-E family) n=1 Tax=Kribbella orskensis TaxID=2512216 RepID=A0ABY2BCP2_9ACTN|nr:MULTISPECIES: SigE family RNA polymerase sigma factor [Kribbella]TCN35236.1 RNA polymerase sigma-70 factor (sigma-E family) [Kribbella sp. VKM Ac-2500]TCO16658.1 RNA polymerase sigma-70 factor (sigma-E family) [Kribbella orskensis]
MEFEEYASARGQELVRLGFTVSGDYQRAEDLAQIALMQAFRAWRKVQRSDDPHNYVRRILINSYLSMTRRRSFTEAPAAEIDTETTVPDPATDIVNSDDLWQALARLSARERVVLVLRYYQDMDDRTIADLLGIKPSSVRATASRALAGLRKSGQSHRVDERLS